jgi:E3 ubiquitin-protein ligase UHRF1
MATTSEQLPCDADGVCMVCKNKPQETETLNCRTCASLWHVPCLPEVPTTILDWECPDCSTPLLVNDNSVADTVSAPATATAPSVAGDLISAIRAIENDASLTDVEKAKKRQELVGGSSKASDEMKNRRSVVLDIFDGSINCSFCMQLPERPVTVSFFHFSPFQFLGLQSHCSARSSRSNNLTEFIFG